MLRHTMYVLVISAFISLLCIENAHAYIDPGTGSMLLQALLAGGVAILAFWRQIKMYFSARLRGKDAANDVNQDKVE